MAYKTVGTSNNDMCRKLRDLHILKDPKMFDAFDAVDRGLFAFNTVENVENR